MVQVPDFERVKQETIDALKEIGTATIAGALGQAGIRNPHMVGLIPFNAGKTVAGQAVTLQFVPKREDIHWGDEYSFAPDRELHRVAIMRYCAISRLINALRRPPNWLLATSDGSLAWRYRLSAHNCQPD